MTLPPSSLLALCLLLPQLAGAAAAEMHALRLGHRSSAVRAFPQIASAVLARRPFHLVAAAGDIRGRSLQCALPQRSLGVLRAAEFRAQFFTGSDTGSRRDKKNCKVFFTQKELRSRLTPLQYHVTQEKGTESAFAGEYTHQTDSGTYKCVVCGTALFKSETKFDSSSGWPSFYDVISLDTITFTDDFSYGMHRVETSCSHCGAHLGHLFDDGPRPTGKRYCINSASLSFVPEAPSMAEGSSASSPTATEKTEL